MPIVSHLDEWPIGNVKGALNQGGPGFLSRFISTDATLQLGMPVFPILTVTLRLLHGHLKRVHIYLKLLLPGEGADTRAVSIEVRVEAALTVVLRDGGECAVGVLELVPAALGCRILVRQVAIEGGLLSGFVVIDIRLHTRDTDTHGRGRVDFLGDAALAKVPVANGILERVLVFVLLVAKDFKQVLREERLAREGFVFDILGGIWPAYIIHLAICDILAFGPCSQ